MKRLFVLFTVILVTVSALANRSFNGTEVLYLNAGAVSWWRGACCRPIQGGFHRTCRFL